MAAFIVVLGVSPARAFFVRPSVTQTLGSRNYAGTHTSVDFGGDLHLTPSLNSYHSDDATGTYKTWGVQAAYEFEKYGVALSGGFSPRVNGYANRYVGGEASMSFDFEEGVVDRAAEFKREEQEKQPSRRTFGVSRLDLTVGLTQTQHSDEFTATTNARGQQVVTHSTTTLALGQTDLLMTAALEIRKTRLSISLTKSVYNKDLAYIGARSAQIAVLSGLDPIVQGFPDLNFNTRLDLEMWPVYTPWVSYTYSKFKVTQASAAAYAVGLNALWRAFLLTGSYQRYSLAGGADRNYLSASAAYRFK